MQVRAGGNASGAHFADDFSGLHHLAFFHEDLGEVQAGADEALSMVNHHHVAFFDKGSREQDTPVINGIDRFSPWGLNIRAAVFHVQH